MKYITTKMSIISWCFFLSNISFGRVKEALKEARYFYVICYYRQYCYKIYHE